MSAPSPTHQPKRIAVLGLALESNRFAPVTTRRDFEDCGYGEGEAMLEVGLVDALLDRQGEGFGAQMSALTEWELVPILFGTAGAGGPCDQAFYEYAVAEMVTRLQADIAANGPLDGVYLIAHGAGITTELDDMDGPYFAAVREVVGPDVPIIATLDLHGNISEQMVEAADILIAFLTNPHLDMIERGAEAARLMHEMFEGMRPATAFIRLPLVTAQVAQLTGAGRPYGDVILAGQEMVDAVIANVSILSGFAFADSAHNGMAVLVTTRGDQAAADAAAQKLAQQAWADRERYLVSLTSLEEGVALALKAQEEDAGPIVLADVADNPGGGGRGNTTALLKALHEAGAQDVQMGVFYDPALVQQAIAAGEGARFTAHFAASEDSEFSQHFTAEVEVRKITDGRFTGLYGMTQGLPIDLGASCLLDLGGIAIAVISIRQQIFGADAFEHFALNPSEAATFVVKSRGHFRAGFTHIVPEARVYEVDVPGLTTPNLARVAWRDLARPCYPLDQETCWP